MTGPTGKASTGGGRYLTNLDYRHIRGVRRSVDEVGNLGARCRLDCDEIVNDGVHHLKMLDNSPGMVGWSASLPRMQPPVNRVTRASVGLLPVVPGRVDNNRPCHTWRLRARSK